jgi:NAD(P)-dependent dehydrogenase (short-subunit alcohol dehydrogenase family)
LALTRELAIVHARENIRVNALCPGPLRTELLMKFLDTPEKKQRRLVHIPMGRFGEAPKWPRLPSSWPPTNQPTLPALNLRSMAA